MALRGSNLLIKFAGLKVKSSNAWQGIIRGHRIPAPYWDISSMLKTSPDEDRKDEVEACDVQCWDNPFCEVASQPEEPRSVPEA